MWFARTSKNRRCLQADGHLLLSQVELAASFWTRLKGLLGRDSLAPEQGLLIEPCNSVHTLGMRFAIAVLFLSAENQVLYVIPQMQPGQISPIIRGTRRVLELHPEVLEAHPQPLGSQLRFEEA